MTEVAAEVADGVFFHPFTTARYIQEVTLPALQRGRSKVGKTLDGFQIAGPAFAAVGRTDEELATAIKGHARTRSPSTPRLPRIEGCWISTAGATCSLS